MIPLPPLVQEVTKNIMSIRMEAFRGVIERGDYKHAIQMINIIHSDILRGAMNSWLTNNEYLCSLLEDIKEYCIQNDDKRILTSLELIDQMLRGITFVCVLAKHLSTIYFY